MTHFPFHFREGTVGAQAKRGAPVGTPGYAREPVRPTPDRRARDTRLGSHHFGEPAWDMLLDMFAAHDERKTLGVSSICLASAVPPSTALRCLARLVADGLVVRIADQNDRRRTAVELTPATADEMRRLLQSWMRESQNTFPPLP